MGGRPSLKKTRRDEMKKIVFGFVFVLLVSVAVNVFALGKRSWTELGGLWVCTAYPAPYYDPGWRCPNGEKPGCWKTICINTLDGHITEAYGCDNCDLHY